MNPICFSQFFVNKQNVRSFSNVLNYNFMKTQNYKLFLRNVFKDEIFINELSEEFQEIISEIQSNVKVYSTCDFKDYILIQRENNQDLACVNKTDVFKSCSNILSKIIPHKFYGNNHNSRIFRKCVKYIIFSMKRQYIQFERLIQNWYFTISPWNTIEQKLSYEMLSHFLCWIFQVLLSSIISLNFYVTTCKLCADENKLYFFWKNDWQRFYDKTLSDMVIAKVINKFDPYCLGKRLKRRYNDGERLKLKTMKCKIPKLHLVLKSNNCYRPIVRYKNETVNAEKYKIKEKLNFLQVLNNRVRHEKLENKFSLLYHEWLQKNRPKLYFVKTDLSNAFGSINRVKLLRILAENYLEFQKKEKSLHIKKKFAQHYKEIIYELRTQLLIRAGSTVYEWREGLVQGYKYSPALSEIYYSYLDNIYFSRHMTSNDQLKLFIRVVDDYLYVTESLTDAYSFLDALSNYRNVNYSKTFVNFPHPVIKFSEKITFLGYNYNTVNMQVSRADAIYTGNMCYKIAFSTAIQNLPKFIENRIGQSGIQMSGHIFNFYHNDEKLVWQHIFTTLCLSANKFCTILAILCDEQQMLNYLLLYKKRITVKLCNSIIATLKRNQPKDFLFKYCINHFRYLSYKALLLCSQQTSKCNALVPFINKELARTNCINGKWREHASRINNNGETLMPAIIEVCKRPDLKIIMKDFDKLPNGFRCFDKKRFYE